eukprot:s423_g5.t1
MVSAIADETLETLALTLRRPVEFEVCVRRPGPLGIQVNYTDLLGGVLITKVVPDGLVDRWNAENLEEGKSVSAGDRQLRTRRLSLGTRRPPTTMHDGVRRKSASRRSIGTTRQSTRCVMFGTVKRMMELWQSPSIGPMRSSRLPWTRRISGTFRATRAVGMPRLPSELPGSSLELAAQKSLPAPESALRRYSAGKGSTSHTTSSTSLDHHGDSENRPHHAHLQVS